MKIRGGNSTLTRGKFNTEINILESSLLSGLFKEFKNKFFTKSAFYSIVFIFATGMLLKYGIFYFTQVDVMKDIFHPYSYIFGLWMAIESYGVKVVKTMDFSLFNVIKSLKEIVVGFKSYTKLPLGVDPNITTDKVSNSNYVLKKVYQNTDGSLNKQVSGTQNSNGRLSNTNSTNTNSNANLNTNANTDNKARNKIVLFTSSDKLEKKMPEKSVLFNNSSDINKDKLFKDKLYRDKLFKDLDLKAYRLQNREIFVYSANVPMNYDPVREAIAQNAANENTGTAQNAANETTATSQNPVTDETTSYDPVREAVAQNTANEIADTDTTATSLNSDQIIQIAEMQTRINGIHTRVLEMEDRYEDGQTTLNIIETEPSYDPENDETYETWEAVHDTVIRLLNDMTELMIELRRIEADIQVINPNYVSSIVEFDFEDPDTASDVLGSPRSPRQRTPTPPRDVSSESGYESG